MPGSLSQWNSFLLCLLLSATWTNAKSFVNTVDTNGTVLCAVDEPSLTFDIDSSITSLYSNGTGNCTPNKIRCAWKCSQQRRCLNFNYREDTKRCELFFYRPSSCASVLSCGHSQINNLQSCQDFVVVNYTVFVKTGTGLFAGTDANVYLTIFGSLRNTTMTQLVPTYAGNTFEIGNTDNFTITAFDLGNIMKIKIEHDNSGGLLAQWELADITIINDWHISWYFYCNCYLQSSTSLSKILQATLI